MPDTKHDPTTPLGQPNQEQLRAYAEGRLDDAARHEVELSLERDPLMREAMEGLQLPGATAGLGALRAARPQTNGNTSWVILAGAIFLIAGAGFFWWNSVDTPVQHTVVVPTEMNGPTTDLAADMVPEVPLEEAEILAAVEIPESLHIGHAATDRHAEEMREETLVREAVPVERLENRVPITDSIDAPKPTTPLRPKKRSMQLMYLHDLKLVDPSELYSKDPILTEGPKHVGANFPDQQTQDRHAEQQRLLRYTPFMDAAMAKFARNDHRGCLDELRFLLGQYPDDVNALFYSGLCCYNLGMYPRAETFLQRAATHAINVFDEEAVWYHALAMEKNGKKDAAHGSFKRIVANGGFYAPRASARLIEKSHSR